VRRSVLDGVAPPDMALPASYSTDAQAVLEALFATCEQEAACAKAYPRLRSDWAALLKRLPQPMAVAHPLTGRVEQVTLTRDALLSLVRGPLYAPSIAAALPEAITAAAAGRLEGLAGLSALLSPRKSPGLALGMHFSVVCAEDLPRMAMSVNTPGADFGIGIGQLYERICAQWPRGAVPAAFYTVPASASPVLLLSGGLDPVTPPRHGQQAAQALGPKALHVVVPNAGHGLLSLGCTRDLLFRFIDAVDDAAALAVDAGCLKGIPRPPVFQPAGLVPGGGK
jgi:pimeloyl-ACP methyl ester carboxylesterase